MFSIKDDDFGVTLHFASSVDIKQLVFCISSKRFLPHMSLVTNPSAAAPAPSVIFYNPL